MLANSKRYAHPSVLLISLAWLLAWVPTVAARAPLLDESRGLLTLAPMLEKVTPAVVNISVTARVAAEDNPLMRDPFFRRFFETPEAGPRQVAAAGSGVIIDAAKGLVVTNHHVVKAADRITVTIKDGRQLEAKLIGSDAATDIALLKVEAKNLTGVALGDSDALMVGDVVLAIGNPFGLGQTVTSGIVSALGRSGLSADNYEDFIQTDAPINPGNSGGALVNSKGEAVGINTAIIAPGGGNVGIGFAVPSNMVKAIIEQLERYGEVRRGRIGVIVQPITPDIATALNLPAARGALVTSVDRDSPADRAGVKAGDAILELDGKPVLGASDLRTRIGLRASGTAVTIKYARQGQQKTATLSIEPAKASSSATGMGRRLTGADITDIPASLAAKTKVEGVYVASVQPGSAAATLGLRPGDIIIGVNQKPVKSVAAFEEAVRAAGSVLALDIQRGDAQLLVVAQG
ncbi:MAG TPA: DegQ family serine endoprotease [Reyranella sp.]|nr:DegQ family serine endoprotease [Reyranella sp.]